MAKHSPLYQLIEDRLTGTTLPEYVAANFPAMGWRAMERDLKERTGVSVSYNTLRDWFGGRVTVTAEVAPEDPAESQEYPFRRPVDGKARAAA